MGLEIRLAPLAACLLVAALFPAAPLAAQGSTKKARALFQQGVEALRAGNAERGRDLLRESLAEKPSLPARYNLAMALRRTGDTREAISTMQELLDGKHGDLNKAQRADVEKQLEETREEVGYLRIRLGDGGPEEATLLIDGEERGTISSRRQTFDVDAGKHTVTVEAEGYTFSSESVSVEGQDSLRLTMEVKSAPKQASTQNAAEDEEDEATEDEEDEESEEEGRLIISAGPDQVVEIVGIEKGVGSLDIDVPVGEYEVRADDERKTIVVEANETTRVKFGKSNTGLIVGVTIGVLAVAAAVVLFLVLRKSDGPEVDPITGLGVTLTDW